MQAQQAISNYYLIGYYTTNAAPDGKFRRVTVTVNDELTTKPDYRQGYYAGKQFSKFTTLDKERQLEDAWMLGDPITERFFRSRRGVWGRRRSTSRSHWGELAPGEYDCQVTVLDPTGGKVTFWQAPIEVAP